MSAFLSKVHYQLYEKIQYQQTLSNLLLKVLKQNNIHIDDLHNLQLKQGNLEDIIDMQQIHAWLSNNIVMVEKRMSYYLDEINQASLLEQAKTCFYQEGQTHNKNIVLHNVVEAFQLTNAFMLDGMPCDKGIVIINRDENNILFKCDANAHHSIADFASYMTLREAWMRGLLQESFRVTQEDNDCIHIQKEQKMYNIIENLMNEHKEILSFIDTFEKDLIDLMEKNICNAEMYHDAISFIRQFADQRHHQREEQILFAYLIAHGGETASKLVRQGMLVEHDQARYFVKQFEDALLAYEKSTQVSDKLTMLAYGKAYCDLLRRHIDKEDNVVYPFAQRVLSKEIFEQIEKEDNAYQASLTK